MKVFLIFSRFLLSDEEAVKLIEADVPTKRKKEKSQWNEVDMGSILFACSMSVNICPSD